MGDVKHKELISVTKTLPRIVFDGFSSWPALRLKQMLQQLFLTPKKKASRLLSFISIANYISFRHHKCERHTFENEKIIELGPRFELKPYRIKSGTLDENRPKIEWSLNPHSTGSSNN